MPVLIGQWAAFGTRRYKSWRNSDGGVEDTTCIQIPIIWRIYLKCSTYYELSLHSIATFQPLRQNKAVKLSIVDFLQSWHPHSPKLVSTATPFSVYHRLTFLGCNTPAIVGKGYNPKGSYTTIDGMKTCKLTFHVTGTSGEISLPMILLTYQGTNSNLILTSSR